MLKQAEDLNEKITFTKVNSCESMEKVMSEFLETYRKLHPQRNYDYRLYDRDILYLDEESFSWGAQDLATNSIAKSVDSVAVR
jgi:hypothetical protein